MNYRPIKPDRELMKASRRYYYFFLFSFVSGIITIINDKTIHGLGMIILSIISIYLGAYYYAAAYEQN